MENSEKRNHHSQKSSRPYRTDIMWTEDEYKVLLSRLKSVRNGRNITMSSFIREMVLKGDVKQSVTKDDMKAVSELMNLQKEFMNLASKSNREGMFNLEREFKDALKKYDLIMDYFLDKLS